MEALRFYMFEFWELENDPRISHYPLLNGGPWIAWSIVATYVYFVKHLGPALMKNREPFRLQKLIIIYNVFMILINAYFFYEIMIPYRLGIDLNIYNFERKQELDFSPRALHVCWLSYLYLLSKYCDLVETVFFVLRKKFNQISNLHVYHHGVVPVLVHMFIKVSPCGGPGAMFPLLNTFIHMIMYTYYTLAALGLHQYTWWKKYVTQLQLGQFVIFGLYGWLFLLNQKGYPKLFTFLGVIQPIIFFYMFYSFYKRAYIQKKKKTVNEAINTITNNSKTTTINGCINNITSGFVNNNNNEKEQPQKNMDDNKTNVTSLINGLIYKYSSNNQKHE